MTTPDWFQFVREGGAYCAPLLLAAILWLLVDRARLLLELKERDTKLSALSEQAIVVMTELKTFLFTERKSS